MAQKNKEAVLSQNTWQPERRTLARALSGDNVTGSADDVGEARWSGVDIVAARVGSHRDPYQTRYRLLATALLFVVSSEGFYIV